jgi:uncharacterized membrane protein
MTTLTRQRNLIADYSEQKFWTIDAFSAQIKKTNGFAIALKPDSKSILTSEFSRARNACRYVLCTEALSSNGSFRLYACNSYDGNALTEIYSLRKG